MRKMVIFRILCYYVEKCKKGNVKCISVRHVLPKCGTIL